MLIRISLEANYCIQVLTANENEENFITKKASNRNYSEFNDVRVERRGHHLVFRIGDYKRYKDAKKDLLRIQKMASDAYVRKCDFVKEKAIFIANETQKGFFYQEPKTVQVEKTTPKQESFLKEDTSVVETSTLIPKKSNRTKNKFNIDERFLP